MKTRENACYIKDDKWMEFLDTYKDYGFVPHNTIIYPRYIVRNTQDGKRIQIGVSDPCVNVWDGQDKNGQREVWLWHDNYGYGHKNVVIPYVKDLISAGFIDAQTEEE